MWRPFSTMMIVVLFSAPTIGGGSMTDISDQNSKPWYFKLHWQVLLALVAGVAFGWLTPQTAEKFGFVGDLFLRLLKMIIIILYYTVSTTLAIFVGMMLVNIIKPGTHLDLADAGSLPEGFSTTTSTLPEFLLRMVPDNIVAAMAEGEVLPVIVFALLFGLFLTRLNGANIEAVKRVVDGVLEVIQALTLAIVKFAPVGIFALLAREVARSGPGIIWDLRFYFVTVGVGLLIHATFTLPLILFVLGRRKPHEYGRRMAPAVATAFSTASSSATLPLSMDCSEKAGNRRGVSSFVLPLGATINMDGTALYEAVAALTIAQMYGVGLELPQQALVLLTALLASVGAAGIPMAGLVMLVVVLQAVGLPLEGIGTIIAVDRVLDMMRTATNVWSDLVGTAVVNRFEGSD
jgi:Na+/H+-dicarboxylate symporter